MKTKQELLDGTCTAAYKLVDVKTDIPVGDPDGFFPWVGDRLSTNGEGQYVSSLYVFGDTPFWKSLILLVNSLAFRGGGVYLTKSPLVGRPYEVFYGDKSLGYIQITALEAQHFNGKSPRDHIKFHYRRLNNLGLMEVLHLTPKEIAL